MEIVKLSSEVAIQSANRNSMVEELLDQYEISAFVDAVEANRFDRAFRNGERNRSGDNAFWDDVRAKLERSSVV